MLGISCKNITFWKHTWFNGFLKMSIMIGKIQIQKTCLLLIFYLPSTFSSVTMIFIVRIPFLLMIVIIIKRYLITNRYWWWEKLLLRWGINEERLVVWCHILFILFEYIRTVFVNWIYVFVVEYLQKEGPRFVFWGLVWVWRGLRLQILLQLFQYGFNKFQIKFNEVQAREVVGRLNLWVLS